MSLAVGLMEVEPCVRDVKAAWSRQEPQKVVDLCQRILAQNGNNETAWLYLARASVLVKDWEAASAAGKALAASHPREAFVVARRLNHNARERQAAEIFAVLDIRPDLFDATLSSFAWQEAASLLAYGEKVFASGDYNAATQIWQAGWRIAPGNLQLRQRMVERILAVRAQAKRTKVVPDPLAYAKAWKAVLDLCPHDVIAAEKVARGYEHIEEKAAILPWIDVLAIDTSHAKARERIRKIADQRNLENHAIDLLVKAGLGKEQADLIATLIEIRDAKHDAWVRRERRERIRLAREVDRVSNPEGYLLAWKHVLAICPADHGAARKIISVAKPLGKFQELVDHAIIYLGIMPGDPAIARALASAALKAGDEVRALEFLAREGLADLAVQSIMRLHQRVHQDCRRAIQKEDYDRALDCIGALHRADEEHEYVVALRKIVLHEAASLAKIANKAQDFDRSIGLARKILEIRPDEPVALSIVAGDLIRRNRPEEVIALCQVVPAQTIETSKKFEDLRKVLDRGHLTLHDCGKMGGGRITEGSA